MKIVFKKSYPSVDFDIDIELFKPEDVAIEEIRKLCQTEEDDYIFLKKAVKKLHDNMGIHLFFDDTLDLYVTVGKWDEYLYIEYDLTSNAHLRKSKRRLIDLLESYDIKNLSRYDRFVKKYIKRYEFLPHNKKAPKYLNIYCGSRHGLIVDLVMDIASNVLCLKNPKIHMIQAFDKNKIEDQEEEGKQKLE